MYMYMQHTYCTSHTHTHTCTYCRSGVGSPVVGEVVGEYKFDSKKHILEWRLPVIDASNSNGSMEFNIAGMESDFFPIKVEFISTKTYSHIEVLCGVCMIYMYIHVSVCIYTSIYMPLCEVCMHVDAVCVFVCMCVAEVHMHISH